MTKTFLVHAPKVLALKIIVIVLKLTNFVTKIVDVLIVKIIKNLTKDMNQRN